MLASRDEWTEIGMVWEIVKLKDMYGRPRRIFWKRTSSLLISRLDITGSSPSDSYTVVGSMAEHHAVLAVEPSTSIGVIVLLAGPFPDVAQIAYTVFSTFQPTIDNLLELTASQLYAGTFRDPASSSTAVVSIRRGTLWLDKYEVKGTDVLGLFGVKQGGRMALRSSGRKHEFRLDAGAPRYSGSVYMGCQSSWVGQDLWGVKNDIVAFSGEQDGERTLWVPAANLTLTRSR